tara:strand:- start:11051 stop:11395 length:345 start_codon:yes stop_codon:yes gene_type:complete
MAIKTNLVSEETMAEILAFPEDFDVTDVLRKHLLAVVADIKGQLHRKSISEEPQKHQFIVVLDKLTLVLRRKVLRRHELDEVIHYLVVANDQFGCDNSEQIFEASNLLTAYRTG